MANQEPDDNRNGLLAGFAAVVVLLLVSWFLVHELSASARLQDCLLSGRTNCAPIPASPQQ